MVTDAQVDCHAPECLETELVALTVIDYEVSRPSYRPGLPTMIMTGVDSPTLRYAVNHILAACRASLSAAQHVAFSAHIRMMIAEKLATAAVKV